MIDLSKITLGMDRVDFIDLFGMPTECSATTKKHPRPLIYKYGNIEIGFTDGYPAIWVYIIKMPEHKVLAKNNYIPSKTQRIDMRRRR